MGVVQLGVVQLGVVHMGVDQYGRSVTRRVNNVKQANLPDSETEASFLDGPESCSVPRHFRFYTFYLSNLGRIEHTRYLEKCHVEIFKQCQATHATNKQKLKRT